MLEVRLACRFRVWTLYEVKDSWKYIELIATVSSSNTFSMNSDLVRNGGRGGNRKSLAEDRGRRCANYAETEGVGIHDGESWGSLIGHEWGMI